jgi:multicomponent Na+:H+ antiporter subunit G
MTDILAYAFLLVAAAFMLLAAMGITRMPDLLSRLQTATKAASLGLGCAVVAAAFHFGDFGVAARALAIMFFGFLTVPIAAHMIGRAAYFTGEPLWEGTIMDELRGRYDIRTHELHSTDVPAGESESEREPEAESTA